jgi:hypothetical protein
MLKFKPLIRCLTKRALVGWPKERARPSYLSSTSHLPRTSCIPLNSGYSWNRGSLGCYSCPWGKATTTVKMSTTPNTGGTSTANASGLTLSSNIAHQKGRRLRHFLLPDGRQVHIALSPEEAESLRKRLGAIRDNEPFDLVINGSPEHIDALKRAHSHHESRRENLKKEHGEAYEIFQDVHNNLDVLSSELQELTDYPIALDANFSKYGYSAHLRAYDDHSNPESSRRTSMSGDGEYEKRDWESERRNGRIMKIYKKVRRLLCLPYP